MTRKAKKKKRISLFGYREFVEEAGRLFPGYLFGEERRNGLPGGRYLQFPSSFSPTFMSDDPVGPEQDQEGPQQEPPPGASADEIFWVCYSPTYQVPVMYSSRPRPGLAAAEHPLLGHIVYFLHPCNTVEMMKAAREACKNAKDYLPLWLSIAAPAAGLNLPHTMLA